MRYFNADKTQEVERASLDMESGRLEPSTLTLHVQAVQGQEEQGYFDQANGGVYVQTQPYIEAVEEHDELEEIMLYIPYTAEEKAKREAEEAGLAQRKAILTQIEEKESFLKSTDYMAIKCSERGLSMLTEYPDKYTQRQTARDTINALRQQLAQLEGQED